MSCGEFKILQATVIKKDRKGCVHLVYFYEFCYSSRTLRNKTFKSLLNHLIPNTSDDDGPVRIEYAPGWGRRRARHFTINSRRVETLPS